MKWNIIKYDGNMISGVLLSGQCRCYWDGGSSQSATEHAQVFLCLWIRYS